MMPNESVILVRDLVVKYADRTILDRINLDIMRGVRFWCCWAGAVQGRARFCGI